MTQGEKKKEKWREEGEGTKEGKKGKESCNSKFEDTCFVQELCLLEAVDPMSKIIKKRVATVGRVVTGKKRNERAPPQYHNGRGISPSFLHGRKERKGGLRKGVR